MTLHTVSKYFKTMAIATLTAASMTTLSSCESIYDDLDPCPHGVALRFIYDYNMEFANAFPSQVDCLTVLFYDENGKYVTTRTNATDELKDENYRMVVDLEPGVYNIIAYGGMDCDKSSFHFVTDPENTSFTDLQVELNKNLLTQPKGNELHSLFYGRIDVEIEKEDMTYRDYTVPMMKDTNNLKIVLQQIDGDPLDNEDFEFTITDNNTLFAYNNDLIPQPDVTFYPWTRGNTQVGELPDGGISQVCWAELSFPRLVTGFKPMLTVTRRSDGYRIINIPLNNYLLLCKSQHYADMGSQEFLDRQSYWNLVFFLDRNHAWLQTQIIINDWVVRINDVDFD